MHCGSHFEAAQGHHFRMTNTVCGFHSGAKIRLAGYYGFENAPRPKPCRAFDSREPISLERFVLSTDDVSQLAEDLA